MSSVRIFVSSTCFDLEQVRRDLEGFVSELGYDPVLSDSSTLAIPPGLDNVEACKWLVRSSDILVLIIGGRYGSTPIGNSKSITSIEFDTAVEAKMPTYTFVHKEVWDKRDTYRSLAEMVQTGELDERRLVSALGGRIEDPRIFGFIEHIESCQGHDWIYQFQVAADITSRLKASWSLLFHELLPDKRGKPTANIPSQLAPALSMRWYCEGAENIPCIEMPALPEFDPAAVITQLRNLRPSNARLAVFAERFPDVVQLLKVKDPLALGLDITEPPRNPEAFAGNVTEFVQRIDQAINAIESDPQHFRNHLDLRRRLVLPVFVVENSGTCPAEGIVAYVESAKGIFFASMTEAFEASVFLPERVPPRVVALLEIAENLQSFESIVSWRGSLLRGGGLSFGATLPPPITRAIDFDPPDSTRLVKGRVRIDINRTLKHNFNWAATNEEIFVYCLLEKGTSVGITYECHADNLPAPARGELRAVAT